MVPKFCLHFDTERLFERTIYSKFNIFFCSKSKFRDHYSISKLCVIFFSHLHNLLFVDVWCHLPIMQNKCMKCPWSPVLSYFSSSYFLPLSICWLCLLVDLQFDSLTCHLNLQIYHSLQFFLLEWSGLFDTSFRKSLPFQNFQFTG